MDVGQLVCYTVGLKADMISMSLFRCERTYDITSSCRSTVGPDDNTFVKLDGHD